jgi:hypothetical protein
MAEAIVLTSLLAGLIAGYLWAKSGKKIPKFF